MKFSLSHILLFIAFLAACLGWYLDKMQYASANLAMIESERFDERRKMRFVTHRFGGYSDAEYQLLNATSSTFMKTGNVLELLAIFNCRNDEPKNDVVYAHAVRIMATLKCKKLTELQHSIEKLEYDPRIIMDADHPLHQEFSDFLTESINRYPLR